MSIQDIPRNKNLQFKLILWNNNHCIYIKMANKLNFDGKFTVIISTLKQT